ncbi:MAG TPA: hypothetical protein VKN99_13290 [Polyangia bacterium]|nr:hypothetical protein [Polyangia bacterium]
MRALLLLHAAVGLATVGALTHHAVWVLRELGQPRLRAQSRRYARLGALLVSGQLALGSLMYPVYRVRVQLAVFQLPALDGGPAPLGWAGRLFALKQQGAAGALVLALLALLLYRAGEDSRIGQRLRRVCAIGAAALAWFAAVVGLLLTSIASIAGGGGS